MTLEAHVQGYQSFFARAGSIPKRITTDDEPLKFDALQGIGKPDNLDVLIDNVQGLKPYEIERKFRIDFSQSFISDAFFYYIMWKLSSGTKLDNALETARDDLFIHLEYKVHSLKKSNITSHNSFTFFMDWDDTIGMGNQLRNNTRTFLEYFDRQNKALGMPKYNPVITTGGFEAMKKLKSHSDILDYFSGIYSVPAVHESLLTNPNPTIGKLYTDICKRLHIPFTRALVLTDSFLDRSVENNYPLLTIVTPPNLGADRWIDVVNHFIAHGDGNLTMGAINVKRNKKDTLVVGDKFVRTYHLGDDLYLWRMRQLNDTFFIYEGDPKKMDEAIGKALSKPYIKVIR